MKTKAIPVEGTAEPIPKGAVAASAEAVAVSVEDFVVASSATGGLEAAQCNTEAAYVEEI